MKTAHPFRPAALALGALALALLAGCSDENRVLDPATDPDPAPPPEGDDLADLRGGGLPLADAEIFLEFNATDDDLGVQIFLDGDDWDRMKIFSPTEEKLLDIRARSELGELGLTELRFESAEPSPAEVLALFAPGEYRFVGTSTDGERLVGAGDLSHDLPDAPVFTPTGGALVDPADTVIRWSPAAGAVRYQVIVANEDTGAAMEVDVSGATDELRVAPTFLEPGTEYKAEVLAISDSGNKTISEGLFHTTP